MGLGCIMEKTRIVNMWKEKCQEPIGRPTPFGNPYRINADRDRDKVVELYREYFYKRIEEDEAFKKAIEGLKGKVLGCFCKPLACHGDIICEYLEGKE